MAENIRLILTSLFEESLDKYKHRLYLTFLYVK